jgi:NAD(P)-dependent dehydrogenase (short-subunit alcohol dehydrogenase family)
MGRLDGKVAIVTGAKIAPAGGNIGSATAAAMAHEGAAVVVADLDGAGAELAAAQIRGAGGHARAVEVDISDEPAVERMVATALDAFGGLDVLVNNAAYVDAADRDPLTMDVAVWDRIFAVNARGTMLGCKHAVAAMLERGGGSIVNVISTQALGGHVTRTAYAASKGAIDVLTKYVASIYGKRRIRCNALAPGLTMSALAKESVPEPVRAIHLRHTLGPRVAEPDDIASCAVFLASDEAAMVNGVVLVTDGGLSSARPFTADLAELMAG